MAYISPRKRASIVTLHQYNQASSKDISKIDVPQTSVSRIIRQYQLQGQSVQNGRGSAVVKGKPQQKMMPTF